VEKKKKILFVGFVLCSWSATVAEFDNDSWVLDMSMLASARYNTAVRAVHRSLSGYIALEDFLAPLCFLEGGGSAASLVFLLFPLLSLSAPPCAFVGLDGIPPLFAGCFVERVGDVEGAEALLGALEFPGLLGPGGPLDIPLLEPFPESVDGLMVRLAAGGLGIPKSITAYPTSPSGNAAWSWDWASVWN
jgi:hypothetical protein